MPDTLMVSSTLVAEAEDRTAAAALVGAIATGRRPRVSLDAPLPPAARPTAEILADALDELERDLGRLRRRRGAPQSAGGRIRLAVAEAALLGGYARDVANTLAALRAAGVAVVSAETGERDGESDSDSRVVVLRLRW